MDIDEILQRHGEQWRRTQPEPPALPLLANPAPSRRSRHHARRVAVVASAAAVIAVGVLAIGWPGARHHDAVLTSSPSTTAHNVTPKAPSSAQRAALAAWAGFPVAAPKRPLVLLEAPVQAPEFGFPDNTTKDAFASGEFVDPATLPPAQSTASGYLLLTPVEALGALHAQGDHLDKPAPLTITNVQLGNATFLTDRGRVTLPAWQFWFNGITNPASVLAVANSQRYSPPGLIPGIQSNMGAAVGTDDRTITLTIAGAAPGTGPCTADYTADAAESVTAVAIDIHEVPHGSRRAATFCTQIGYQRTVKVTLRTPLGSRVLVDAKTKAAAPVDR